MRKFNALALILLILPIFVAAQTLDEKLKEIDAYATTVIDTWKDKSLSLIHI